MWPAVHHVLVTRAEADPWRLGGWAMYCTPQLEVATGLVGVANGIAAPIDPRRLTDGLRARVARYNPNRRALGHLLPPDRIAGEVLAQIPEIQEVRVGIRRLYLDPGTDRIAEDIDWYSYRR